MFSESEQKKGKSNMCSPFKARMLKLKLN